MLKGLLFALIITTVIVGTNSLAWAAQLDARINPNSETSIIEIKYQRTIFFEYPEGGDIADLLRTKSWDISVIADSSDPGVQELIQKLNQKLSADGSNAQIIDCKVDYSAKLTGRGINTAIDYKLILTPTLSSYTLRAGSANSPALIDAGWRGLTVAGPITVGGVEINQPISALKSQEPEVYSIIAGSEADTLLSKNIINAERIKNLPLGNWHFLFDPTGINVDAGTFGLSEEISGFVVSSFTMGESSIREGRQVEQIEEASFISDKQYFVRSVQSADSAEIDLIGFAAIEKSSGIEAFGVSPTPPQGYTTTSTGGFPVMIIYGMAGMAGVGAIAVLFLSSRKLKKEEGMGQQGIDPSQLRGVATSAASGGYQTVRGEAQLASTSDYAQTRSVYDIELEDTANKEKKDDDKSTRGSMPKGWKPS